LNGDQPEALEFRLRELEHRIRNTLATIIAMIDRTAATAPSVESFAAGLRARVAALADLHESLGRGASEETDVVEMAKRALLPHAESDGQVDVRGSGRVFLTDARPLFMALHELAANARKHGALSVREGRVVVDVETDDEAGELRITWRECDGPPARPPERTGFGMAVITRGLAYETGGTTRLAFEVGGLRAHLTVPLDATSR
jgi:two-component sensor histidine kinase